jgi:hypothetical protein
LYAERKELYKRLAAARKSLILTYVTGDRRGLETQIASDAVELIGDLLDHYEGAKRISLFLYTRGGETLAGWSLVKLLREFCEELEVIIPSKCHSAGTLICLGADKLVMTKQATLSPIDPSVNTPLNPSIPNAPLAKLPISVEDVAGFIEMARSEGGIRSGAHLSQVFMKLASDVHPIVLGRVIRARGQIKKLARNLLNSNSRKLNEKQLTKILNFLCVEAGSHDYMIYRTEARNSLKLNIETPSMNLYKLIKEIYQDIRKELLLDEPYNPAKGLTPGQSIDYQLTRVLIESQENGGYHFRKKGTATQLAVPQAGPGGAPGPVIVNDNVTFEGWEFVA